MKTALVTGANKGIGREVARQLAAKGFHVFVGARNRKAGGKAADEIGKHGGKAAFLELDVSSGASDARIRVVANQKQGAAGDQRFQRRWSVDGRRGWLGAGLLHFENCSEWRDVSIGGGASEICGEFGLSGLGADGHGRIERNEIRKRRGGHDCVAGKRSPAESNREISAGSEGNSVVTVRLRARSRVRENYSTWSHLLWSLSMISRRRRIGGMPWLSSSL